MIRVRFTSLFIFLVLGCFLAEDVLPYLTKPGQMELLFCDDQKKSEEGKYKSEGEFDLFKAKENVGAIVLFSLSENGFRKRPPLESDDIPLSASRAIFSPPPELI